MLRLHCHPDGLASTIVEIGPDLRSRLTEFVIALRAERPCFVLADPRAVVGLGLEADLWVEGGESAKTWPQLGATLEALAAHQLDRAGVVVAIGGGSLGDLGGLAASLWLRGVGLVMVPTTLLSMVDSSVGGKTAVNLPRGKNLVGTFWSAERVRIDPEFLTTLPEPEYRSGLGEVLKVAIGLDAELAEHCERAHAALLARDADAVGIAVQRCLEAKIRIVEADPREGGLRRLLNLGHTLGHALEADSGYAIPHGITVARGIYHVLELAERTGHCGAADAARGRRLLERFGFEAHEVPAAMVLRNYLVQDKKRQGARIHAVLPTGIGSSKVVSMDLDGFLQGID